jgi:hypothetical protein
MVYHFVTKKRGESYTDIPDLAPNDYQPFSALKQNPSDNKFKDDREVKTAVTRGVIKQGKNFLTENRVVRLTIP